MDQEVRPVNTPFRKSGAPRDVRLGMRYVLLLILVALLVFLSNQVWQMLGGTPLF